MMTKSASRQTHQEATHQRDDDDYRVRDEDERQAHEVEVPAPAGPADPTRHPVLEQIFGKAPIEAVPEGSPLPPPRRPLQAPILETSADQPLVPPPPPQPPAAPLEPLVPIEP
jgi:hypothetical protein